ncbi:UDP-N-acetylglucosamine 2-epimerase [Paenibacillus sp. FSL W7-1287]|uniref:UDP-N-acetylglucosamine 2-epimerase n=1 Tax=Paenibacillus sp. FSL W7-1287 TaxID=2954538 RepID=UPI0030FA96A2
MTRKICIVTGTRAEYGLLKWLMKQINEDELLELQIIATGMHLSTEFGLTYQQIEQDGFYINEKVEMLLSSDTPQAIVKSVGLGTILFSEALSRLQPDIVVLLGDRFEIFSAAQAAMLMRIPIAHIHGGELTEGAVDDPIRHSITKMSQIHFAATEHYRQRIIQMGEQPETVYNVGALGIEGIVNTKLLNKSELANSIGFSNLNQYFLVTLHPTTLEKSLSEQQIQSLLAALDEYQEYQIIFTKANADTEGRVINQYIDEYVVANSERCVVYQSLGQLRYLSAMKHCVAVVGNSSSGILEAPFLNIPTVDIGVRQKGRLKAASIVECEFEPQSIKNAIDYALTNEMKIKIKTMDLVYGNGNASSQIKKILKQIKLDNIIIKRFYDIVD